jgi:hypothetical protein
MTDERWEGGKDATHSFWSEDVELEMDVEMV